MNPKIKRARQGSNPNLALTSSTKVQLNKEAHTMLTKTKQFTNTLGRNIDSLPFYVQQLISAISSLKYAAGLTGHIEAERFSRQAVYALRPFIPYVVHETEVPEKYIFLNRDYKPLGIKTFDRVVYCSYSCMLFGSEELELIKPYYHLFQGPNNNVDGSFFMDDCPPWISKQHAATLIHRLEKLASTLNNEAK